MHSEVQSLIVMTLIMTVSVQNLIKITRTHPILIMITLTSTQSLLTWQPKPTYRLFTTVRSHVWIDTGFYLNIVISGNRQKISILRIMFIVMILNVFIYLFCLLFCI